MLKQQVPLHGHSHITLNATTKWLGCLLHIQDVLGLILIPEAGYPDQGFSWVFCHCRQT